MKEKYYTLEDKIKAYKLLAKNIEKEDYKIKRKEFLTIKPEKKENLQLKKASLKDLKQKELFYTENLFTTN